MSAEDKRAMCALRTLTTRLQLLRETEKRTRRDVFVLIVGIRKRKEMQRRRERMRKVLQRCVAHKDPVEDDSCAICLDELKIHLLKTPCNHVFHSMCLAKCAFLSGVQCPVCRGDLLQVDG